MFQKLSMEETERGGLLALPFCHKKACNRRIYLRIPGAFTGSISCLAFQSSGSALRLQEEALLNISKSVQSIPIGRGGRLICSNRHLEWRFLRLSAPAIA